MTNFTTPTVFPTIVGVMAHFCLPLKFLPGSREEGSGTRIWVFFLTTAAGGDTEKCAELSDRGSVGVMVPLRGRPRGFNKLVSTPTDGAAPKLLNDQQKQRPWREQQSKRPQFTLKIFAVTVFCASSAAVLEVIRGETGIAGCLKAERDGALKPSYRKLIWAGGPRRGGGDASKFDSDGNWRERLLVAGRS
ncbi:unnamed protein product, partial [Iphiclides podalirius]